ncbi:uncharacterized protein B0T15DRAFT_539578 [Chaetomium strumarium]|uniref:Uncharacterized protein n=1 Tax=Chaetomium strumarium TaxID=1170767 RepID=A0AAJ0LZE6_9PEZI|nr:hypothetical protein B0T15DRAFT_539578 [Chaetomium strumarium]
MPNARRSIAVLLRYLVCLPGFPLFLPVWHTRVLSGSVELLPRGSQTACATIQMKHFFTRTTTSAARLIGHTGNTDRDERCSRYTISWQGVARVCCARDLFRPRAADFVRCLIPVDREFFLMTVKCHPMRPLPRRKSTS